tara:strand:- start:5 stop:427 length:423 start_codon:yes stop_codon:yes gene_type:complete
MNNEKFLESYMDNKDAIWIKAKLDNGSEFYMDKHQGWRDLKKHCSETGSFLEELQLQFRSHEVNIDIDEAEGVYLVRSVLGKMGGPTRDFFTVGILKGEEVRKTMWCIPELVIEESYTDNIESCFEEALIYNEKKKNGEE